MDIKMRDAARQTVALVLGLALCLPQAAARADMPQRWHERLAESSTHLKRGEFEKALKIASSVTGQMVEYLGPGNEPAKALGIALTQKALALAGLGRQDDAIWTWHTVLNIYPSFARSDLSAFGEPGVFLKSHLLDDDLPDLSESLIPLSIEPRVIKEVQPKYPWGAQGFNGSGYLILEAVITKDGTVTSPRVVTEMPHPTLIYAALDALHLWRYEPGVRRGKPVDVPLKVTVHFELKSE